MQSCVRLKAHAPTLNIVSARKLLLSTEIIWGCEGVLHFIWHNQWISEIEFFIRVKCSFFSSAFSFSVNFMLSIFVLFFFFLSLSALATYFLQFLNICEAFSVYCLCMCFFFYVDVAIHKWVKNNAYKLSKMLWILPIERERAIVQ